MVPTIKPRLEGRAPAAPEGPVATAACSSSHARAMRAWLVPALLILLALSLRFFRLGAPSLWLDEGASLRDADELSANAGYRPLYYLLLRVWAPFGSGEAWLRAPSVLCSAGAVLLLYLLARRVSGTRPAVLAALLMVLSVQELDHAQEVRMYALGTLLSLASLYALLRWHERRGLPSLAGHLACAAVALATTPSTLLVIVPAAFYAAWRSRQELRALAWLGGGWLAVLLAVVPLLAAANRGLARFEAAHSSFSVPPLAELAYLPAKMLVSPIGFLVRDRAVTALFNGLGVCCLGLIVAAICGPARERLIGQGRLLALWFSVPCLGLFVFAHAVTPLWTARYFQPLAPVLFLVLAIGLVRLMRRSRLAGVAAVTFVFAVMSVRVAIYFVDPQREDWRSAVAWANAVAGPEDVVCLPGSSATAVWRFYDRSRMATRELRDGASDGAGTEEQVAEVVRQMPRHPGRTLLVTRRAPTSDGLEPALTAFFASRRRLLGACRFGPLTVRLALPEHRRAHPAPATAEPTR